MIKSFWNILVRGIIIFVIERAHIVHSIENLGNCYNMGKKSQMQKQFRGGDGGKSHRMNYEGGKGLSLIDPSFLSSCIMKQRSYSPKSYDGWLSVWCLAWTCQFWELFIAQWPPQMESAKETDRQKNKLSVRDRKPHGAGQYHYSFLGLYESHRPQGQGAEFGIP